jgi:hypothetical protein
MPRLKNMHLFIFLLLSALFLLQGGKAQTAIKVRTAGQLRDALKKAEPGLCMLLSDGEYDLGG